MPEMPMPETACPAPFFATGLREATRVCRIFDGLSFLRPARDRWDTGGAVPR